MTFDFKSSGVRCVVSTEYFFFPLAHNVAKSSKLLMITFELKACTHLESKDITELFFSFYLNLI